MIDLIDDAIEMINDIGPEKAAFINHILSWEEDMKIAFKLAYLKIQGSEDEKRNGMD